MKFANESARRRIDAAWVSSDGKLAVVSGKVLLSKLSEWGKSRFGTSLSARRIARELTAQEIDLEIRDAIFAIEEKGDLADPAA